VVQLLYSKIMLTKYISIYISTKINLLVFIPSLPIIKRITRINPYKKLNWMHTYQGFYTPIREWEISWLYLWWDPGPNLNLCQREHTSVWSTTPPLNKQLFMCLHISLINAIHKLPIIRLTEVGASRILKCSKWNPWSLKSTDHTPITSHNKDSKLAKQLCIRRTNDLLTPLTSYTSNTTLI